MQTPEVRLDLIRLKGRMERELRGNILPFWLEHTVDRVNGGFVGALTTDLQVRNDVERSLVLCARILWTFSAAYRKYREPAYLEMARHAYDYLTGPFLDREYGGMYWWIDCQGRPVNDRKQTYGQAFAIYGLSEYFLACADPAALRLAQQIYALIEKYAHEPHYGGYIEGCSRSWGALSDMRLSEKEPYNCPKSMNSLLHVLEGYTNLLRAWPGPELKDQQAKLLQVFLQHVIDPQTHLTRLFFENDWRSLSDHFSFGHDIETSWLIVEAAEVLEDASLIDQARQASLEMAEAVYRLGLDADGAVMNEGSPRGILSGQKHWWGQAEGIVGFINAYQFCPPDDTQRREKYAAAALRIWDFIEEKMIDRQYGEWLKMLERDGQPADVPFKTGPWEDPYHHSRACLEILHRVQ